MSNKHTEFLSKSEREILVMLIRQDIPVYEISMEAHAALTEQGLVEIVPGRLNAVLHLTPLGARCALELRDAARPA